MAEAGTVPKRVALLNLGCRVNRVELDAIALSLQETGCELVRQSEADVIVVNTCAVTGEAQAKTRKAIRHAAGLSQEPYVVATGCVASLFADELSGLHPHVLVEADKRQVAARVCELLGAAPSNGVETSRRAVERATPTGRTRPGIKVQDGCDNRCTFCIVWKARGPSRSVAIEDVVAEVRAAQRRGAHEVVLTGINLGNYRATSKTGAAVALPELVDILLSETDVARIRLSSIEPPDVNEGLLRVMAEGGRRVAPFLHICLQSGCDRTLREMGRVYDSALFAHVVEQARAYLPDLALGTDLIVGFPGETDEDFAESLAFCRRMAFAKMHVFRYSRRPGTPAANRLDQVEPRVIAIRSSEMIALAERMRREQAHLRVGKDELVVVQRPGRGVTGGLFDALVDDGFPVDAIVPVKVKSVMEDGVLDARAGRG